MQCGHVYNFTKCKTTSEKCGWKILPCLYLLVKHMQVIEVCICLRSHATVWDACEKSVFNAFFIWSRIKIDPGLKYVVAELPVDIIQPRMNFSHELLNKAWKDAWKKCLMCQTHIAIHTVLCTISNLFQNILSYTIIWQKLHLNLPN